MTIGTGLTLLAVVAILIEALNIWLGLRSDRLTERLRRALKRGTSPPPWADRTGTRRVRTAVARPGVATRCRDAQHLLMVLSLANKEVKQTKPEARLMRSSLLYLSVRPTIGERGTGWWT
jgi:hypothetical protein